MPREDVVQQHLDMMTFEAQVLAAPRPVRKPRRAVARPRRTAFVIACVTATVASCGLSAAGALPEPLQHITDTIAHTLGVPDAHDATPAHSGAAGPRAAAAPTTVTPPATRPSADAPAAALPAVPAAHKPATRKQHVTSRPTTTHVVSPPPTLTPPAQPPTFPARPTKGPHRIHPQPQSKPPSTNSDNTPAGYPDDWRDRAIAATAASIQMCTQTNMLDPTACPQSATAGGPVQNVHWTLLNDPTLTAAAIAHTTRAANGTDQTVVTVYERFQMDATYTAGGVTHLAYSSGVAQATMTWSGTEFEHVTLANGSVAGHLERGVTLPGFVRPAGAVDLAVLGAVHDVFANCTAPASHRGCPSGGVLDTPTAGQSTLNGDPTSGATVGFDRVTGLLAVNGTYSMTTSKGTVVSGPYTALLFFDGLTLQTLSVT